MGAIISLTDAQVIRWIGDYFWPFCRVGAFFLMVPIIGTRLVSVRIRLVLALGITWVIAPTIHDIPDISPLSAHGIVLIAQQLIIGFIMGFMVQVLFQICVVGGQMIAMQTGLGFATLVDPVNGINVASISQLYLMSSNLIFLAFNGHIWLIKTLHSSFSTLPVALNVIDVHSFYSLMSLGSWLFSSGLMVALPAVTAILLVNLSFGIMTKVAPQMNIIAIGFPLVMVLGLVITWVSMVAYLPQFQWFTEQTFTMIEKFLKLP